MIRKTNWSLILIVIFLFNFFGKAETKEISKNDQTPSLLSAFFWELPPLWEQSNVYQIWGGFHKYLLPYIVYIILGAHVLGALKHQFIDKHDSAFKRIVS